MDNLDNHFPDADLDVYHQPDINRYGPVVGKSRPWQGFKQVRSSREIWIGQTLIDRSVLDGDHKTKIVVLTLPNLRDGYSLMEASYESNRKPTDTWDKKLVLSDRSIVPSSIGLWNKWNWLEHPTYRQALFAKFRSLWPG